MAKIEKLEEPNKVKITFEVGKEDFAKSIEKAYQKNRGKFNIAGFRKGKVPKQIIMQYYGEGVFFEDAINNYISENLDRVIEEEKLEIVSRPDVSVDEVSLENGAVINLEVYTKPEAEVSDYKGIEYKKVDAAVADEEIDAEIQKELDKNARIVTVTDRGVMDKDIISIDFEGFIDGIPFEGGKGENYDLIIGSKTFIDNFEDQLIGAKTGDEVVVSVTFPGEYGKEELQGKPATFNVKINEIKYKELPNADDDFASEVSEFDTIAEYKDSIKNKISDRKVLEAKNKKENEIMEGFVSRVKVELPEAMVENRVNDYLREFQQRLQSGKISLEDYLKYTGKTIEDLREDYKDMARKSVLQNLGIEAIIRKEDFEITEDDINQEIEEISKMYGVPVDSLKKTLKDDNAERLKGDIRWKKAFNLVIDSAKEVE